MTTRAGVVVMGALICACGAKAIAPESPAATAPAPAAEPDLRITIEATDAGATATLQLAEARDALPFAVQGIVRRSGWTSATEGVAVGESGLSSAAPFSSATIRLPFDTQEHDRAYPAVTRVGRGLVLFTPSLLVGDIDLELTAPDGTTVWPPLEAPYGYSYLGVADDVRRHGDIRLIGFDALAPWLAASIEEEVDASLPYYAEKLGRATAPPTIIVSDEAPGPMQFHGDVTDNAVIFLRFFGDAWQSEDPRAVQEVAKFVRHEAFHLWNRTHAESAPPWLHEGGAEYAALVAAVTAGVLSEDDARTRLSRHVSRCRRNVGDGPMADVRRGSDVYDCGVTLQWLADLHVRRTSSGKDTVLTIWSQLLREAEDAGGYTVEAFMRRAGPLARDFATDDEPGRWQRLRPALPPYDVELTDEPTDDDRRAALLVHLLRQACGDGPIGYWTEPSHIKLDTGEHCGPLSGQPRITKVGGHPILTDGAKAFAVADKACQRGGKVAVTDVEGKTVKVACKAPLVLPSTITLRRIPPIAAP